MQQEKKKRPMMEVCCWRVQLHFYGQGLDCGVCISCHLIFNAQACNHPRKRMFRARAHANPLNETLFDVPIHPRDVNWCVHLALLVSEGCTFGHASRILT